ncbi:MAG: DUF4252 domain-containing protein, partial [Acidobacteriota bacterium]|nr:DUF4252 domain-containing protein [Acidobacteriota bacterium]
LAAGCGLAALLWAQQFKFNLDHLAAKASNAVDVSLNKDMLQFAGKFLSDKDSDEAKAKAMIGGLEGIYIKSFEFARDGAWSQADLDQVRNQLKAPEWGRIMSVKSSGDNENVEVWVRRESGKVTGIALLATEPREFTVANIVGNVNLDSLADLGGQFGLPKLKPSATPAPEKKKDE